MVSGFHHVAIRAHDFDASMKLYINALGFKEAISWGAAPHRSVMLDMGDGSLLEVFEGATPGEKPEGAVLHFAMTTDDCDAAFKAAMSAGATVHSEPKSVRMDAKPKPFNLRIAFCKGLDGELFEFMQFEK